MTKPKTRADVERSLDVDWPPHQPITLTDLVAVARAAPERALFDHILVDEYQDLNKAEQGVIDLLGDTAEVCIVGDDDQSLYSFKHAHPAGIREFPDETQGSGLNCSAYLVLCTG
jgi:superfamily I DNA/RNA helicase